MPADIDLRAEVLAGIDQRIATLSTTPWKWGGEGLWHALKTEHLTALRHLREIVERHKRYEVGYVEPTDATCDECRQHWPCPTLLSLAPDYAPQAWAARQRDIECPCSCHNESNVGLCEDCSDRHAPQALAQMEVNRG